MTSARTKILLAALCLSVVGITPVHSQLPEADPSVYSGQSPEVLLKLSFLGINRKDIRAYLAEHQPNTVEGTFSRAWMLYSQGKYQEAADAYTTVYESSAAWPELKSVAAGNRTVSADIGKLASAEKWHRDAIKAVFETGDLNSGSVKSVEESMRPLWLEMHQKYPQLIQQNRAAHLLNEARYYYRTAKDYTKTRKLVDELWSMDLDEWTGSFDFALLAQMRTSSAVYEGEQTIRLLVADEFPQRLLTYVIERTAKEKDPVRRATVASWAIEYARLLLEADTRHRQYAAAAAKFILDATRNGALALYPSGEALAILRQAYDLPRDGNQLSEPNSANAMSLEEMADAATVFTATSDAQWLTEYAILLERTGKPTQALDAFKEAAKASFHPESRAALLFKFANVYAGPHLHDTTQVSAQLEALFQKTTPNGRRDICADIANLAFNSGDMAGARKWLEQFQKEKNISLTYAKDRLSAVENVETMLKNRDLYQRSNPLETQWQSQHGQQGISVQLNFRTNSAELPADTDTKLAPILKILDDPSYQNLVFRLEGHTDNTGTDAINNPLSIKRAQSLANYLETQKGVTRGRLELDGFGSRRPIASNLSESGQALNRRVELNLMGDAARPSLVTTGALNRGITTVSPDGRLLVSYNGDVWDTREWVRLYSFDASWDSGGISFSPDGKYLMIANHANNYSVGLLLDARTGILITTVPCYGSLTMQSPTWSPDSTLLAFTSGNFCFVYNVTAQRFLNTARVPGADRDYFVSWIKGGHALALVSVSGARRIYTVDISTQKITELEALELGWAHAMTSSTDGHYLYITDDRGYILNWDTLTESRPSVKSMWSQVLQSGKRFAGKRIVVHPADPQIIAVNGMHSKSWGIINFAKGTVSSDNGTVAPYAFWGADAHELLVSGGWVANEKSRAAGAEIETGIYRMDLSDGMTVSNEKLEFIKGLSAEIYGLKAFENLNLIAAIGRGSVSIWDVTTGGRVHQWSDNLKIYGEARSAQDGVFYGLVEDEQTKKTHLIQYDLTNFRRREITVLDNFKVSSFDVGPEALALGGGPFLKPQQAAEKVSLRVLNPDTGSLISELSVNPLTEPLQHGSMQYSGFASIAFSPSGQEVAFVTKWADGYGYGTKSSNQFSTWAWKQNGPAKAIKTGWTSGIESVHYEKEALLRVSDGYSYDPIFDLAKGERTYPSLPSKDRPNHYNTAPLDDAFASLNLKIEYASRGEIYFRRRDTGEKVITVLQKGEEWIASNTDGYFVASPGGTDKVFWRVGSRMLPLETLRGKFENPALLADSLKGIFEKRTVMKPVNVKPVISPDLFSVPYELKILSPTHVDTKTDKYTLKVEVKSLTGDAEEPQFVWTSNGRAGRGFKVVPAKPEPQLFLAEHEFDLVEGSNELAVALRYKDAVILRQSITVKRAVTPRPTVASGGGQHLWFFGVGVKDYEKPDQNLDYPDRDVQELAKMLESQQGTLYKEVHTKILTNADATVRNIKIEMNRFLKEASSQDLVVIFLAGHGVVGTDQELYFVAHDSTATPAEAYTGLELRDFSDFLERRPPTQKAVFLMDICHAGSFGDNSKRRGGGMTTEDAVKMMEEGTGTVVLASSTGRESSLEDERWRGGHGAFTAALLDGLEGLADAAEGDSDGFVSLLELASFVSRQVPKMTDGAQHPTMPRMENVRDFPICKKR